MSNKWLANLAGDRLTHICRNWKTGHSSLIASDIKDGLPSTGTSLSDLLALAEAQEDQENRDHEAEAAPRLPKAEDVSHALGHLPGIYNPNPRQDQRQWILKPHPQIHLHDSVYDLIGDKHKKLLHPLRVWVNNAFLKPKHVTRGVSPCYPDHLDHEQRVKEYLSDMYQNGILYKRHSLHEWELPPHVQRYSWEESLKTKARINRQVNGHVFLVDRNTTDSIHSRLVVDLSSHSRALKASHSKFPKYYTPPLQHLRALIPKGMQYIGLDLSSAFYHIPVHPESASQLKISDGQQVYGFRKLPMGHGISPFALQMWTSDVAQWIRKRYAVGCIAYMDDFLLFHAKPDVLSKVSKHAVDTLATHGVVLNIDKSTPSPVKTVKFMGYIFNDKGVMPNPSKHNSILLLLMSLAPSQFYDYKIWQRIAGHYCFQAPFLPLGLLPLRRLYSCIGEQQAAAITVVEHKLLIYNLLLATLLPFVSRNRKIEIACDASEHFLAVVDRLSILHLSFPVIDSQAHREIAAATHALSLSKHVLTDARHVHQGRGKTLPLTWAAVYHILRVHANITWCYSHDMPADSASRGGEGPTPFPAVTSVKAAHTRHAKQLEALCKQLPKRAKLYNRVRFS